MYGSSIHLDVSLASWHAFDVDRARGEQPSIEIIFQLFRDDYFCYGLKIGFPFFSLFSALPRNGCSYSRFNSPGNHDDDAFSIIVFQIKIKTFQTKQIWSDESECSNQNLAYEMFATKRKPQNLSFENKNQWNYFFYFNSFSLFGDVNYSCSLIIHLLNARCSISLRCSSEALITNFCGFLKEKSFVFFGDKQFTRRCFDAYLKCSYGME